MIRKDVKVRKIFLGIGVLFFVIIISLAVAWYINRPTVREPPSFQEQGLVVGCTNNFPPFDLLDKNGNHIGYARDISTEVARELGYAIEYRTSPHWVEVVEWLKNGDIDLIHLIAYSAERDEYFDFTIPHTLVPEVIFVRSERLDIHGLDDLEGKQIGAVRRHITHEKLLKYEDLNIVVFETPQEGVEALLDGKVDAFAYPEYVFAYLVQQMGREGEIKIVGEPLGHLRYGMAVREGDHVLLSSLDQAIQQIEASGKRDEIAQRWFGREVFLGLTQEEVSSLIRWAVFGLLVISLGGSAYIYVRYKLRKAEAVLRHNLIFQHMDDSAILTSLDGKITDWNPGAERMFGHSREEILGRRLDFLLAPESSTELFETISRDVQRDGIWSGETRAVRKDGSRVACSVRVTALRNEKGDVIAYTSIIRDITERKRIEEALQKAHDELEARVAERTAELAQANIQLKEMDRIKSEFLATMSHELRTPLNSIIGFTGIILQGIPGELNEEQRKQLNMVNYSAKHLLDLINDILDLSRIESGKMEISKARFKIQDVVSEISQSLSPMISQKGLRLITEIPDETPETYSDRKKVLQILLNLVSNAVKFTPAGEVRIECKFDHDNLEVSVADTGIGIKEEDMTLLFEAFRQIDGTAQRRYQGAGLGLYLCQKLVTLLGGNIWAESEHGRGSRFTFTLPFRREEGGQ